MSLPAKTMDGVDAFLSVHGTAGEYVRFSKDATFILAADGAELPQGTRLNCIYEQTQHGWIRFNGSGNTPTRHMGPMFGGYVPPQRSELGDDDPTQWEPGLDGKPKDPWQEQVLLPLQDEETGRLFVFQTSSNTGLRSVGSLIATCSQMARREPDVWPIVELGVSSFEHRDPRIGLVRKPYFRVVGKADKKRGTPQIGVTEALNDDLPF